MLHHDSMEGVQSKQCNSLVTCTFMAFFVVFVFLLFLSLFLMMKQNINKSETNQVLMITIAYIYIYIYIYPTTIEYHTVVQKLKISTYKTLFILHVPKSVVHMTDFPLGSLNSSNTYSNFKTNLKQNQQKIHNHLINGFQRERVL